MKITVPLLIGIAATLTAAQEVSDIPSCALACFVSAIQDNTNCGITDNACQCVDATQEILRPIITPCVQGACANIADQLSALKVSTGICAKQNGASPAGISSAQDAAQSSAIASVASVLAGGGAMATPTTSLGASPTVVAMHFTATGAAQRVMPYGAAAVALAALAL